MGEELHGVNMQLSAVLYVATIWKAHGACHASESANLFLQWDEETLDR